MGNSNCSTGFGEVYGYWVLGPLGLLGGSGVLSNNGKENGNFNGVYDLRFRVRGLTYWAISRLYVYLYTKSPDPESS